MNHIEIDTTRTSTSPRRLKVNTFSDTLKSINKDSKVIGVLVKNRSAILPVGHLADYAIWYDIQYGQMVTSTYYAKEAPQWLTEFNSRSIPDSLLSQVWNPLKPLQTYQASEEDDSPYEKIYKGKTSSTFPYDLAELKKDNGGYELLMETPYGNTLVTEMAMQAISSEQLGQDDVTDFLSVSYSSTDLVGHAFGIRFKEIEDTYVRMDIELEKLLTFLDQQVGEGQYLVFLTADHGASDNPKYLRDNKSPRDFYTRAKIKEVTDKILLPYLEEGGAFLHYGYNQVYLADKAKNIIHNNPKAKEKLLQAYENIEGVKSVFYLDDLIRETDHANYTKAITNGYHAGNSGDIYLIFQSGWLEFREFGTTHGSFYNYDTHVPLLWYDWGIESGESKDKYPITSIVPTLYQLLDIPYANDGSRKEIIFE